MENKQRQKIKISLYIIKGIEHEKILKLKKKKKKHMKYYKINLYSSIFQGGRRESR